MFYNFILHDDVELYKTLLKKVKKTIYHDVNYLLAEEKAENYPIHIFVLEESNNIVLFPSIIRKVNDLICFHNLDDVYYDLITPHEYSGPITNSFNNNILKRFYGELEYYCLNHNIVCQFIRFNPYLNNHICGGYINTYLNCEQIYVDLEMSLEEMWVNYSSVTRKNIRRGQKSDLRFRELNCSDKNISKFVYLYQTAMKYLEAKEFLYFNKMYFEDLLKNCNSKLFEVYSNNKDMIASGILLCDGEIAYFHLSSFDRNYSLSRPMNYLFHSIIVWCKNNNYKVLHLGGGGKSLYHFKSGFSKKRINHFIGSRIYLDGIYSRLCTLWEDSYPQFANLEFIPKYRATE